MTVFDYIDVSMFGDSLAVGAVGFVAGALLPWAFRLVAYLVESVKKVLG